MANSLFEAIEHTADIGIRVKGKDLKEIFLKSALSLFKIIAQKKPRQNSSLKKIKVLCRAKGLEELLISWLNELLSLSQVHKVIFEDFQIKELKEDFILAVAVGRDFQSFKVKSEVKAATYHGLKLEKTARSWQAEIVFDV